MGASDTILKGADDAAARVTPVRLRTANGEEWTIYANTIFNIYGAGLMAVASKKVLYPEWYAANVEGESPLTGPAKARRLAEAQAMMDALTPAQKAQLSKAGGDAYFLNSLKERESSRTDSIRTKVSSLLCSSLDGSWAASLYEEGGPLNRRDIQSIYNTVTARLQEKSAILAWKKIASLINYTWTPGTDVNTFVQRKLKLYAECQLMLPTLVLPETIFVGQLLSATIAVDELKNETSEIERKNLKANTRLSFVESGKALATVQERDAARSMWRSGTRQERSGTPASKAKALVAGATDASPLTMRQMQDCLNEALSFRSTTNSNNPQPSHGGGGSSTECWSWRDAGACKFGDNCSFDHASKTGTGSGGKGTHHQPKKKGELCTKCGRSGHTAVMCNTSVMHLQLAQASKVKGLACLAVDMSHASSGAPGPSLTRVSCLRSLADTSPTITGYLDSGSNHTIFPASAPLLDIQACNYAIHGVDARNSILVNQKGSIDAITSGGARLPFNDVLRSEHVKSALFSVAHFDKAGYTTIFGGGKATIVPTDSLEWTSSEVTTEAAMDGQGMYPLTLDVCVPPISATAAVGVTTTPTGTRVGSTTSMYNKTAPRSTMPTLSVVPGRSLAQSFVAAEEEAATTGASLSLANHTQGVWLTPNTEDLGLEVSTDYRAVHDNVKVMALRAKAAGVEPHWVRHGLLSENYWRIRGQPEVDVDVPTSLITEWNTDDGGESAPMVAFAQLAKTYWDGLSEYERLHAQTHMSAKNMRRAYPGLKIPERMFCAACVRGKIHSQSFKPSSQPMTWKAGERLESDGCGPYHYSLGGATYTFRYTCSFSKYVWNVPVKHMDKQLLKLNWVVADSQSRSGRELRVFKADGHPVYDNAAVRKFLLDRGARLELSGAYAPQSNGLPERMNRTIDEATATIMAHAGDAPAYLWAEAQNCATFVYNHMR